MSSVKRIAVLVKSQDPLLIGKEGFEVKQFTARFSWHLVEQHFWVVSFNLIQGVVSAWRSVKFLLMQNKMNKVLILLDFYPDLKEICDLSSWVN